MPPQMNSQLLLLRLAGLINYHMLSMFLGLHQELSPEGAQSSVKNFTATE